MSKDPIVVRSGTNLDAGEPALPGEIVDNVPRDAIPADPETAKYEADTAAMLEMDTHVMDEYDYRHTTGLRRDTMNFYTNELTFDEVVDLEAVKRNSEQAHSERGFIGMGLSTAQTGYVNPDLIDDLKEGDYVVTKRSTGEQIIIDEPRALDELDVGLFNALLEEQQAVLDEKMDLAVERAVDAKNDALDADNWKELTRRNVTVADEGLTVEFSTAGERAAEKVAEELNKHLQDLVKADVEPIDAIVRVEFENHADAKKNI